MNISNLIDELYLYSYVRLFKLGSPLPFMGVGSSHKNRYFSVDFYLPEDNIIIEYNGAQHYLYNKFIHKEYKKFVSQVNRDLNLQKYCYDNGIKLLIIPYTNYKRISKIIETFINYGIDTTTKVYPRILPAVVENKCKDLVKWTSSS